MTKKSKKVSFLKGLNKSGFWNFFSPMKCIYCSNEVYENPNFCKSCRSVVEEVPQRGFCVDEVLENSAWEEKESQTLKCYSLIDYSLEVQVWIKLFKYDGFYNSLAGVLSEEYLSKFKKCVLSDMGESDLFLSIPLHNSRLRERGFNQAELFCKFIGEILEKDTLEVLSRNRNNSKQAKKNASQRLENSKGLFSVKKKSKT